MKAKMSFACLIILTIFNASWAMAEEQNHAEWSVFIAASPEFGLVFPDHYFEALSFWQIWEGMSPRANNIIDYGVKGILGYSKDGVKYQISLDENMLSEAIGLGCGLELLQTPIGTMEISAFAKLLQYNVLQDRLSFLAPQFIYFGIEPLVRANVFLFCRDFVLSIYAGGEVRWLIDTAFVVGGPVGFGLEYRWR